MKRNQRDISRPTPSDWIGWLIIRTFEIRHCTVLAYGNSEHLVHGVLVGRLPIDGICRAKGVCQWERLEVRDDSV